MSEIVKFQNAELACNVETLKVDDAVWFRAKDVAIVLEYTNPGKAVRMHVDEGFRSSRSDLVSGSNLDPVLDHKEKATIWISEPGLYQLIFKSKMKQAYQFTKWVAEDVLPSIRKTGCYQAPKLLDKQISLMNETDLHYKVVDFIRNHYPDATIVPGLGELQKLPHQRRDAFFKGYKGGQPDLIILDKHKQYDGFAIELKNPNGRGTLSQNQQAYLGKLLHCGFKCLVSNDYDEIITELIEYFRDVRFQCPFCTKKFKCLETLSTHQEVIHKIG